MMEPKTILETDRIYLKEFTHDDVDALAEMDRDPSVMAYIGNGSTIDDKEETKRIIERAIAGYQNHPGLGIWAAIERSSNKFIGWFCLRPLPGTEEIEIGYRLLRSKWDLGYATEVSTELLRYGFERQNLKRIVAMARLGNERSARVLEKTGFRFESSLERNGREIALYSLEKE